MTDMKHGFISAAVAGLAGAMTAMSMAMPTVAGVPTPTFVAPVYDGLGRKVKPPVHPRHNSRKHGRAFADFKRRVEATHSFNPDPRDDKYLHSRARLARANAKRLAA